MSSWTWERPRLRDEANEGDERRTSWLELFYDLVFVAVIAQLSHRLSENLGWRGVAEFAVMFVPVWWLWIGGVFYNERFETNDLSQRVFTLLQMLPVATMAGVVHGGFGETSVVFAWSYVAARIVVVTMWLRGGYHNPIARPMTSRYALGFLLSVSCWIASVWFPMPQRALWWALGLWLDLATPLVTLRVQEPLPEYSRSRLRERFGLFVVIVLGEAVVAIVDGIAHVPAYTAGVLVDALLALVLVFSIWWVYFDHIMGRPARPPLWRYALWGYAHMPLLMSIVALAAGLARHLAAGAELDAGTRWLICGSLASALGVLGFIEWTLEPRGAVDRSPLHRAGVRVAAGLAVLSLGFGWLPGGALGLLAGANACMAGQVFDGWFLRRRVAAEAPRGSSAAGPEKSAEAAEAGF